MCLHIEPGSLWQPDRLFERVGALPVEIPVVDFDQWDSGLPVRQDGGEREVCSKPVHVGHHGGENDVAWERTAHHAGASLGGRLHLVVRSAGGNYQDVAEEVENTSLPSGFLRGLDFCRTTIIWLIETLGKTNPV